MKSNIPSENLIKLRELTEKIERENKNDDYQIIIKQLKEIIEGGLVKINASKSPQTKIKHYESMCTTITNLLNLKFI